MEVLVYDWVAYEANEVDDDDTGVLGDMGLLTMVWVEVDRIGEPSVGPYVVDLAVDKEI